MRLPFMCEIYTWRRGMNEREGIERGQIRKSKKKIFTLFFFLDSIKQRNGINQRKKKEDRRLAKSR